MEQRIDETASSRDSEGSEAAMVATAVNEHYWIPLAFRAHAGFMQCLRYAGHIRHQASASLLDNREVH